MLFILPSDIRLKLPEFADLNLSLNGVKLNPSEGFTAEAFLQPNKAAEGYQISDIRELLDPSASYASAPISADPDDIADILPSSSRSDDELTDGQTRRASTIDPTMSVRRGVADRVDPAALGASIPKGPGPAPRASGWRPSEGNRFPTGVLER